MKFKGTIVITDPCYLLSGLSEELNDKYWEESNYGENLSIFGLTQWISDFTIYGDWSCSTCKGTKEEVAVRIKDLGYDMVYEHYTYGKFCADSGMVCVCYLDEITKFNPNFKSWADSHPWCVTIIDDFEGNIEYEVDGIAHIVGIGNKNFYTI